MAELEKRNTMKGRYFEMITKRDLVQQASVYLQQLDFVAWDRWIDAYEKAQVVIFYGWITRKQDQYKDFVQLEFFAAGEGYQVAFTTSSEKYTHEISRILGMEEDNHQDCQRIEDLFPTLKNAIKLPKILKPSTKLIL